MEGYTKVKRFFNKGKRDKYVIKVGDCYVCERHWYDAIGFVVVASRLETAERTFYFDENTANKLADLFNGEVIIESEE